MAKPGTVPSWIPFLGVVGALIGGWLFNTFAMVAVEGFTLYGLLVAVVGASTLLLVFHAVSLDIREVLFTVGLEN